MPTIDGIVVDGQIIDTIVMPNGEEISVGGVTPEGTKTITQNGTTDVTNYANADVQVYPVLEDKAIYPEEYNQVISYDEGYDGLNEVTIYEIPSNYVGSAVPRRATDALYWSGYSIVAPAGYYINDAIKNITPVVGGTPKATKGTVSNHSVSVTPSVTNITGYIEASTITGTPVTVSASELVSGTLTLTDIGTADVTNYATVSVSITDGNNLEYGITDGTIPKAGIAKAGYAELGE